MFIFPPYNIYLICTTVTPTWKPLPTQTPDLDMARLYMFFVVILDTKAF